MTIINSYYKVFYRENEILKSNPYNYDDEEQAKEVAQLYKRKSGVTDVEIFKYELHRTEIKDF